MYWAGKHEMSAWTTELFSSFSNEVDNRITNFDTFQDLVNWMRIWIAFSLLVLSDCKVTHSSIV